MRAPEGARLIENVKFSFRSDIGYKTLYAILEVSKVLVFVNGAVVHTSDLFESPVLTSGLITTVLTRIDCPVQSGDDVVVQLENGNTFLVDDQSKTGIRIDVAITVVGALQVSEQAARVKNG